MSKIESYIDAVSTMIEGKFFRVDTDVPLYVDADELTYMPDTYEIH